MGMGMRPMSPDAHGHVERGGYLNKSRALSIRRENGYGVDSQHYHISQTLYLLFPTYNLK